MAPVLCFKGHGLRFVLPFTEGGGGVLLSGLLRVLIFFLGLRLFLDSRLLKEVAEAADVGASVVAVHVFAGFENAEGYGRGHLAHELGLAGALGRGLLQGVAAEEAYFHKPRFKAEISGRLFNGRDDVRAYDLADHLVAGDVKAIPELHVRLDARGFGGRARQKMGGDGEIRCAAADVDGGDAHGGFHAAVLGFALPAVQPEVVGRVAHMLDHDFVIEKHHVRAARLVPFAEDFGQLLVMEVLSVLPSVPAHAAPDDAYGELDPALEDAPLGHGHGRGHGEDDAPEMPRFVRELAPRPVGRGIDVDEGLGDDFAHHEHHEGRAREVGAEERLGGLLAQGGRGQIAAAVAALEAEEGRAELVELTGEETARYHGFASAVRIVAPALDPFLLVPQVALGARHARIALGARGKSGEARGLGPDTHAGGPGEGRCAASGAAA